MLGNFYLKIYGFYFFSSVTVVKFWAIFFEKPTPVAINYNFNVNNFKEM